MFVESAFLSLTPHDQILFEQYGQGPSVPPKHLDIKSAIQEMCFNYPNQTAVEHENESITYAELELQSNRVAALLFQQGVRPGDHVALFVQRSVSMVIGLLGILKVGAAYVPQDVRIVPAEQLKHIATTANTKIILTLSTLKHLVPDIEGHTFFAIDDYLQEFAQSPTEQNISFPKLKISRDTTCFVLFTSGTTGKPNGVQVTHGNVCNILLTEPGSMGMKPGLKVSQILNISFDMAAWEILGALSHGSTLVIRGQDIQKAIQKVDIVIATPSLLGSINANLCKYVKFVAVAGEPCPQALADQWSQFSTFYNSCGPTEVTIVNTMQNYSLANGNLTIGKPTPNNTVYILNEDLSPCKIGEIGEMWGGGDCVSKGYLKNDELNNERYKPDPFLGGHRKMFRTRDLGRWNHQGELEHFGRTDDQVKIRGFRVELDSVSRAIETVENCKQAVTLKLDSRTLAAFVSPKSVDITAAKNAVEKSLPYYCTPAVIIALDELPMTARGKIDKRMLTIMAVNHQEKVPAPGSTEKIGLAPADRLWLKVSKHPLLMPYNRLAVGIMLINLIIFLRAQELSIGAMMNLTLINFAIAILIRQHHVVNALFAMATSVPTHYPIKLRWALGKVYHFGGIHVGGFFSGTMWLLLMTMNRPAILPVIHLLILSAMIIMALPKIRGKYHNQFEIVARFGGWTSLVFFWIQTAQTANVIHGLVLLLVTFSVALPWLRLKKVPIKIDKPSGHVILADFNYGVTPFAGSSTELSRNPLFEWHSFANVPIPQRDGFKLTISRAGDWTGKLIDECPSHIWVKAVPTAGVGNVEKLFKKVIWVATGSGIGPCLPHLFANHVPSMLVWSTRNPRKTYGNALVDEILKAQPNAVIWDTDKDGKPNLSQLAYQAMKEFGAEAVICISNKKVTWDVVYAMESRGIPAFGAIWDS